MEEQNTAATVNNLNAGYKQELKRSLKLRDLLVYGLLFVVPVAPVATFGSVAHESHGMVISVYILGLICMIFTALSYAHFSKRFPYAGSVYSYVQRGLNPHVGFLAGWLILIDYILVPCACYALSSVWLGSLIPGVPYIVWFSLLVIVNSFLNYKGIDWTKKTNFVFLFLQCILVGVFVALAVIFVAKGGGYGGLSLRPIYQPENFNMSFITAATTTAVMSFLGFDAISSLSEEAIEPEKNIGKATILTLLIAGAIFMIECYVAALVVPDLSTLDPDIAFIQIGTIVGGQGMHVFMTVTLIVAAGLANACVAQSAIARILYSMSRDHLMPAIFGKIHKKYKTPHFAIIIVAVIGFVVGNTVSLSQMFKLIDFGALTSFMLLNFSVFWFFFIKEKNRGPGGVFKYCILPFIGLFIILYVWLGFNPIAKIIGLSWLAVGIIYGAIKSKGYKEVPDAFKNLNV